MDRKKTKQVIAGDLKIGKDAPVSVQSMTNKPIEDVKATINQINELKEAGAELVRLAVRDESSVLYLKTIIDSTDIPLCADIHFNYKIAIESIKAGINKIRINPGNIGDTRKVKEVIKAAKEYNVPIRIGVNGGSINRKKYSSVTPESLVDSAMEHIKILEDNNFFNTVVSIKSSEMDYTIEANKIFSETRDYPLHIGLTEAGYGLSCIVQSSMAIGSLLMQGIGNTIRVSMTGDPVHEIPVAKKILESSGLRKSPVRIISCPTCGRTDPNFNILQLAEKVEKKIIENFGENLLAKNKTLNVAVMGCEVNGPGEAQDADFGIAGIHGGTMLIFSKGEKIKRVDSKDAMKSLIEEIAKTI